MKFKDFINKLDESSDNNENIPATIMYDKGIVKFTTYEDIEERNESAIYYGGGSDPTIFNAMGEPTHYEPTGKFWCLYGFLVNNTWKIDDDTYEDYDDLGLSNSEVRKLKTNFIQKMDGISKAKKVLDSKGIKYTNIV